MAELNVGNLFDTAYEALAKAIKLGGYSSTAPWDKLVQRFGKGVGAMHFDDGHASVFHEFRKEVKAAKLKAGSEGAVLAEVSGISSAKAGTVLSGDAAQRCAAIKTLRHTYFLRRKGAQQIWVVSLPKSFSAWPDRYFNVAIDDAKKRLDDTDEQFSSSARKHLSDAAQNGLAWVQKALILLDNTAAGSRGLRVVKRWFADEDTTDAQIATHVTNLKAGLKKIEAKLSAGSLMITDFVPIRHSADANDQSFVDANAFVWADKRDVIYVEPPFFKRGASNVFHSDLGHWTRIIVHELSHREVKTQDKRYGWAGIKPNKGSFPHASAIVNADSWAIFIADAANAMTEGAKYRGLNGA